MFDLMQRQMQLRLDLLVSGALSELAGQYLYPHPIYVAGKQYVVRDPAEMETALRRVRTNLAAKGMAGLTARVRAVELPRAGRFRLWLDLQIHHASGLVQRTEAYLHYCVQTPSGLKTEMSDYLDCTSDWLVHETRRARA